MNKLELKLSVDELNMILESLGHLPYARVFGLISNIQSQVQDQLSPSVEAPAAKKETVKL